MLALRSHHPEDQGRLQEGAAGRAGDSPRGGRRDSRRPGVGPDPRGGPPGSVGAHEASGRHAEPHHRPAAGGGAGAGGGGAGAAPDREPAAAAPGAAERRAVAGVGGPDRDRKGRDARRGARGPGPAAPAHLRTVARRGSRRSRLQGGRLGPVRHRAGLDRLRRPRVRGVLLRRLHGLPALHDHRQAEAGDPLPVARSRARPPVDDLLRVEHTQDPLPRQPDVRRRGRGRVLRGQRPRRRPQRAGQPGRELRERGRVLAGAVRGPGRGERGVGAGASATAGTPECPEGNLPGPTVTAPLGRGHDGRRRLEDTRLRPQRSTDARGRAAWLRRSNAV